MTIERAIYYDGFFADAQSPDCGKIVGLRNMSKCRVASWSNSMWFVLLFAVLLAER